MPTLVSVSVSVPVPRCVLPNGASNRPGHGVTTGDDGAISAVGRRTRRTHAAATYNPGL